MSYTEQTIVATQKRLVKKFQLAAHSGAITTGITGPAFQNGITAAGGYNNDYWRSTEALTGNSARLASIKSSCNGRYTLVYEGTPGATAFDSGAGGNVDFVFERFTIPNTSTAPTGNLLITPTTCTGTIILEFVL